MDSYTSQSRLMSTSTITTTTTVTRPWVLRNCLLQKHSLSPTSTVDLSPAVGGFSNSTASPIPHHNRSHSQPHNHTHTLQTPPSSHGRHTNSVNGDGNGNGIGAQALASPLSPYSPTGPGNGSHSIHSPYRTPSAQGGYSETGHSHGQSHQGGIPPPSPASYTPQSQQYQNQQNATHQGQSQGVYTGSTSTGISVSNAWSHTPAQTSVVQGYGRWEVFKVVLSIRRDETRWKREGSPTLFLRMDVITISFCISPLVSFWSDRSTAALSWERCKREF